MTDKKKNRFGADSFYCTSPSKDEAEETMKEAIKESHYLDEREEYDAWRGDD